MVTADLSGLVVRLRGLDDALVAEFASAWGPFITGSQGEPFLDVEVGVADHVIATDRAMRPSLRGDLAGAGAATFRSDEGEITLDAGTGARARVGRGNDRWRFWGLVNLVTAALAVRLPGRPGALLHAAGIVLEERAFLLVGQEGAGKSTFARVAREAGARVIGDDAVVVDGGAGALCLLGSPVRAHEASRLGPGRWPIAAILHARKGPHPRLDALGRVAVEAAVTANLPFLLSGWGQDARLDALVAYLAESVPHRVLTFAPDPSFVEVLRTARL